MNFGRSSIVSLAAFALAACQSPAPPVPSPAPTAEPRAPIAAPKPEVVKPAEADPPKVIARLAPNNPVLDEWKQRAAEHIHQVNRKDLFEGRPEHLLRAVIIVEVTVDRQGSVINTTIRRSPGIASLNTAAMRSVRNASPLPSPPASLLQKGVLTYHETWLVRKDGRFQLRTLALPQE